MELSLIANKGIHLFTFRIVVDTTHRQHRYFREWYHDNDRFWEIEPIECRNFDGVTYFHKRKDLIIAGVLRQYLDPNSDLTLQDLSNGSTHISPVCIDDEMQSNVPGNVYKMSLSDRKFKLAEFENVWLPLPYFPIHQLTNIMLYGAVNWSRFKLVPVENTQMGGGKQQGKKTYDVILAFDTRAKCAGGAGVNDEMPVFPDKFSNEIKFKLCSDPRLLLEFTSPLKNKFIEQYLFSTVHPDLENVRDVKGEIKLSYISSYALLIEYLATQNLFPDVTLYKDEGVLVKDVDMVVDIGNSRTTALMVELDEAFSFNNVTKLQLSDFTQMITSEENGPKLTTYDDPFDMRLAFRKVNFGNIRYGELRGDNFQPLNSRQFVYPSFVRLGKEANILIHRATEEAQRPATLSTLSSPKRYLWDLHPSDEEWRFLVFPGEKDEHILDLTGVSCNLKNDGNLTTPGQTGGMSFHYSRGSLMQLAFLEMLSQAEIYLNSFEYRQKRGNESMPRRIRRLIITCPTAMSKVERASLNKSANNAVELLSRFKKFNNQPTGNSPSSEIKVDVIPVNDGRWYYDEATASQLVYVYSEIGYNYRGACKEFFNTYGKFDEKFQQPTLTIASVDIGAGTTDLMISKYSYTCNGNTTIKPDPLFYDSFYYAGDDMLYELVMQVMFYSKNSAFRKIMSGLNEVDYRQRLRNFFGPDYAGQTYAQRQLRRDFNIQFSVPLMNYFLQLLSSGSKGVTVRYEDVFKDVPVNESIIQGFNKVFNANLVDLEWKFDPEEVSECVNKAFSPYLKKVAAMIYAFDCDIVLLSGRPASLKPIRDIFLKFYGLSPDRLILLNNHYVGHWYPFDDNTGYITDPKTIVAMGALIGYYGSTLNRLDGFTIDMTELNSKLESVVKYIETTRESGTAERYFIRPDVTNGEFRANTLPVFLSVNQVGIDSYPKRKLFCVDFNKYKLGNSIKTQAERNGVQLSDIEVRQLIKEKIDALRLRMPFRISVEKSADDNESLTVTEIVDRNDTQITDSFVEINVQSLGTNDRYWLDSGAFKID